MNSAVEIRTALVVSYSDIAADPRVRREVDWLVEDGWTVDTLGLGEHPTTDVREHFALAEPRRWIRGRVGTLLAHTLLTQRQRFRTLLVSRIPDVLRQRVRGGHYDLVVFNECEFAPWADDPRDFTEAALRGRRHLDLHEWHNPHMRRRTLGGRITGPHYRWVRRHIGSKAFTSRSVVNIPIGKLYAEEFGIPVPVQVRNAPAYVPDLEPSDVDPTRIKLLYHGLAGWARGFQEILDAFRELPDRFSMTFMLTPNPAVHARLQAEIAAHPAADRLEIVPPVPMREIANRINPYDVEVIFFKPTGVNLQFALPNKYFEAEQGRLAVVVGETETMAQDVRQGGHGLVVPEFTWESLRDTIAQLDADNVAEMKRNAAVAAETVNSASEGRAFIRAIADADEARYSA